MKRFSLILIACAAMAVSCLKDEEVHLTEPENEEPQQPVEETRYTLSDWKEYKTGIAAGLSAIVLNERGDGFYAAHDKGLVYEIGLDGTVKGTVPFESSHDWEGITVDRTDGTVYLCDEREWAVYKLSPNHQELIPVTAITVEGGTENRGFEGIACGGGNLYLANQDAPKRIYVWSLSGKKVTATLDLDFPLYVSDIYYDDTDGTLWITDSKRQALTNIRQDGTVVEKYDISAVQKPEGFCMDRAHGRFWFTCDDTSKIHCVSFK